MLEQLTHTTFEPYLTQSFQIKVGEELLTTAELVEITQLPKGSLDGNEDYRQPFSLVFRTPDRNTHLPQQIYTVSQAELGDLVIFLVPVGPDREGMRYEAVFT